jgi:hypothetical protein
MTSDMTFECLLVTHDAVVFGIVSRIPLDLSICTEVCLSSSKALLHEIWKSGNWQKPTVVAISPQDRRLPRVHIAWCEPRHSHPRTRHVDAGVRKNRLRVSPHPAPDANILHDRLKDNMQVKKTLAEM